MAYLNVKNLNALLRQYNKFSEVKHSNIKFFENSVFIRC